MKTKKPVLETPEQKAKQKKKEKILLQYAKRTIPGASEEDDPFGDRKLFDQEVARYFVCEGTKMEIDPNAKGKHRHIVKTRLFGGKAKHLDSIEVEEFRKSLTHP